MAHFLKKQEGHYSYFAIVLPLQGPSTKWNESDENVEEQKVVSSKCFGFLLQRKITFWLLYLGMWVWWLPASAFLHVACLPWDTVN